MFKTIIVFILILLFTLDQKYLGKMKQYSLHSVLSKPIVQTIHQGLLISFVLWLIFYLFQTEIEYIFGFTKENMSSGSSNANNDANIPYGILDTRKPTTNVSPTPLTEYTYDPTTYDQTIAPEDTILQTPAGAGPSYETSHGSVINHPELTQGLTTEKVTPKPIYYEPGTVPYKGLGYVPSYSEMIYYDNYSFKSEPQKIDDGNPLGFCSQTENIMNNIEEKCNALDVDVCSTTDCCVLVGGQKCVEGNINGPKNKVIYSDTTIKNRDAYYYKGKCYGNC